jgi:hypothetical protein
MATEWAAQESSQPLAHWRLERDGKIAVCVLSAFRRMYVLDFLRGENELTTETFETPEAAAAEFTGRRAALEREGWR